MKPARCHGNPLTKIARRPERVDQAGSANEWGSGSSKFSFSLSRLGGRGNAIYTKLANRYFVIICSYGKAQQKICVSILR